MKRHSFTTVELLAVITIIIILVGISVAVVPIVQKKTRDAATIAQIMNIHAALKIYYDEWGYFPQESSATALGTSWFDSIQTESGRSLIQQDNFKEVDAYGNAFYYQCPGVMNTSLFDLWTAGQDGLFGNGSSSAADAQSTDPDDYNADDLANWKDN